MKTNIKTIWIVALALGVIWDFLFWEKSPGISFSIFVFLCLSAGLFLFYSAKLKPASKSLWLFIPIIVFSLISFMRQEPFSLVLSIGLSLLFLQILAMSILDGKWLSFGFIDYFIGWIRLWQSVLFHPMFKLSQPIEPQNERSDTFSMHNIWKIIRGIMIALPILFIYTFLLSSADAIFAQKIEALADLFSLEKFPEYVLRLVMVLIIAYALVGSFYHALEKSISRVMYNEKGSPIPAFLGFTESTIVLGSIILLFSAFVSVQFQYFFGGKTNIHINGYTYSEYARRGFGELLAVAVLTLFLLLIMSQISRRGNSIQNKTFSIMSLLMIALIGIILVSSFERLLLYESAYGFTRLRTYTHIFIIWLGVLLVVTGLLEISHRLRFFANAALLVILGFALTLSLLNVDGYIVQRNVERDRGKGELDIAYLAQLSTDATPGMVTLFQSPDLPDNTQDALGASLVCMKQLEPALQSPVKNWQSFTLSYWWAKNALQAVDNRLLQYEITNKDSQWQVISPEGKNYLCESSWLID